MHFFYTCSQTGHFYVTDGSPLGLNWLKFDYDLDFDLDFVVLRGFVIFIISFAGNTLPQGAIPIQINGLNAIPLSAVKSLPISINTISTAGGMQTVAKRTKVKKIIKI